LIDDAAREALSDMPPRKEAELDAITLHNLAIMNAGEDPRAAFEKIMFLLQSNPCPPEAFGNLLLLYMKYDQLDAAADFIAQYAEEAQSLVDPVLLFVDKIIANRRRLFDIELNNH
jgi:tetratricopeptide repeat protein 30